MKNMYVGCAFIFGHVACCSLVVIHGEYAHGTDRRTDGQT